MRAGALVIVVVAAASGCFLHPRARTTPSPASTSDIVITREQIARLNLQTAWEVVKRRAPQLVYTEDASGQPVRVYRHGQGSLYLNENPLLFVDGVRVSNIGALDEIPCSQVNLIRILTGLAATTEYGTNAEGGAILVETNRGARD